MLPLDARQADFAQVIGLILCVVTQGLKLLLDRAYSHLSSNDIVEHDDL